MASFISLSFSLPQPILKKMFQEMPPRKLARVVSSRAVTGTAWKHVLSCCSNKSIYMNWVNCHPLQDLMLMTVGDI